MLTVVAMALSLGFLNPANLKLASPFKPQPRQVDVSTVHKAGWTVNIRRDNFTKTTTCTLKTRSVEFHSGVVVFRMGASVNTDDAWFRIDDGPARSVADLVRQDQDLGYFSGQGPIDNPSGGEVGLPRASLDGAKHVTIRATPRSAPRLFDLTALPDLLAAAKARGCPVERL